MYGASGALADGERSEANGNPSAAHGRGQQPQEVPAPVTQPAPESAVLSARVAVGRAPDLAPAPGLGGVAAPSLGGVAAASHGSSHFLPRTGAHISVLVAFALMLLAVGIGMTRLSR